MMMRKRDVDPYEVILYPYVTEKTLSLIDKKEENKLTFLVRRDATRAEIKNAIEKIFEMKVSKVNTKIFKYGKIAFIKFAKGYSAEELAMRLGVF